jgi:DNA polymerase
MRNRTTLNGRLHDLFNYHAARTGRITGEGPQPTNLPNSQGVFANICKCGRHFGTHRKTCPLCGGSEFKREEWSISSAIEALRSINTRSLATVEYIWGDAMLAVSGVLRALFIASPGKTLMCSDYSAIEAVVIAEITNEEWRKEVFRTHGKIYEMSASKVTGVTLEQMLQYRKETGNHHPDRKKGKILELALAYAGWTGSMKAFGAEDFMTEQEMVDAIKAWRAASPNIVEFWGGQERNWQPELYGVEGMAIQAIQYPGYIFEHRQHYFQVRDDVLYIKLRSGRELAYQQPRVNPSSRRAGTLSISYIGWNSNPKNGKMGWQRMETFGGRLFENICQGTARDVQWYGIRALESAGYPIVLHVYDEDIAEVPEGFGSIEEFERIMSTMPEWAKDWPIVAKGGWVGKRYRK